MFNTHVSAHVSCETVNCYIVTRTYLYQIVKMKKQNILLNGIEITSETILQLIVNFVLILTNCFIFLITN